MKRYKNSNWGKNYPDLPNVPTQWELLLAELKIVNAEENPDLVLLNTKVRNFVRTRSETRYIPEWVLDKMGISVDGGRTTNESDRARYWNRKESQCANGLTTQQL